MVTAGAVLEGELYAEDMDTVEELLGKANDITQDKIEQMIAYLEDVKKTETKKTDHGCADDIGNILEKLTPLKEKSNIILLGGYKGLLHSICLDNHAADVNRAVFIDTETHLPHRLVRIDVSEEKDSI